MGGLQLPQAYCQQPAANCLLRLKVPENRRDLPYYGPQTMAAGAQMNIQRGVILAGCQHFFDQGPVLRKTLVMGMGGRGPVTKQPLPGHRMGPQDPTILQPAQIFVTGILSERVHSNCLAHDACRISRGSPLFNFGASRSSTDGTTTSKLP